MYSFTNENLLAADLRLYLTSAVSQEEWSIVKEVILSVIVYVHLSYSERFPRQSYFTVQYTVHQCCPTFLCTRAQFTDAYGGAAPPHYYYYYLILLFLLLLNTTPSTTTTTNNNNNKNNNVSRKCLTIWINIKNRLNCMCLRMAPEKYITGAALDRAAAHCTAEQHAMSSHELQSALMLTVDFRKCITLGKLYRLFTCTINTGIRNST
jgi:hypothetical protein